MEQDSKPNQNKQAQGFYAEPRVFLSKDGEYLIHFLPGNMIVRKHVNFYLKILGKNFTPRTNEKSA